MKFKLEVRYVKAGLTIFLTAIAIMLAYFLFFRLESIKSGISALNKILAPIFYGLILAYLMTPMLNAIEARILNPLFEKYNWIEKPKKRKKTIRKISVFVTFLIVILFLYLFFAAVIPQLYSSVQNLIQYYNTYTANLINWINKTLDNNPEIAKIIANLITQTSSEADDFLNDVALPAVQSFLLPNVSEMLNSLSASLMKIAMFIWNIVIGLIISLYVLSGKEKFSQGFTRLCYAFLETSNANRFIDSIRFTHKTFIGFLSGKVLDSLIIGLICYVVCLFMKMPYTVLVSVIIGVTNIIPFFGPYIGAIPTTIIILLVDPKKALMFVIAILIIQQLDGNFIGPAILSQSTGLSSFWIIFAITLFGGLFGVVGMIIGVPVTAVIGAGIESLTRSKLIKRDLPIEPEDYLNLGNISPEKEFVPYIPTEQASKHHKKGFFYKAVIGIGHFFKSLWLKIYSLKDKNSNKQDK